MENRRLFGGEGEEDVGNCSATQERLSVWDGAHAGRGFELLGGRKGQQPRVGELSRFGARFTDGAVQICYG